MSTIPEFDGQPLSKREVLIARKAMVDAALILQSDHAFRWTIDACEKWAATKYPLPLVERPRVLTDPRLPAYEWRVCGEAVAEVRRTAVPSLSWVSADASVVPYLLLAPLACRVALWADLYATPNELVPDDSPESGVATHG